MMKTEEEIQKRLDSLGTQLYEAEKDFDLEIEEYGYNETASDIYDCIQYMWDLQQELIWVLNKDLTNKT